MGGGLGPQKEKTYIIVPRSSLYSQFFSFFLSTCSRWTRISGWAWSLDGGKRRFYFPASSLPAPFKGKQLVPASVKQVVSWMTYISAVRRYNLSRRTMRHAAAKDCCRLEEAVRTWVPVTEERLVTGPSVPLPLPAVRTPNTGEGSEVTVTCVAGVREVITG